MKQITEKEIPSKHYLYGLKTINVAVKQSSHFFLLGKQRYLKELWIRAFKDQLATLIADFEQQVFFGEEITWAGLQEIIQENGFFSSAKLIHIKNASLFFKKNKKQIQYGTLNQVSPHYLLWEDESEEKDFEKDTLPALSKITDFVLFSDASIPEPAMYKIIQKQFESFQLKPPTSFIKHFVKEYAQDFDQAVSLARRIAFEVIGLENPNWDEIFDRYKTTSEQIIFVLSDHILNGQKRSAYLVLENLIEKGKSYEEVYYYLLNQMQFLSEVKTYQDRGYMLDEITVQMKPCHPYRIKKAFEQIRSIPTSQIVNAVNTLIDIDVERKKGIGQLSNALIFFIENF